MMTSRQLEIYRFIADWKKRVGCGPTVRDIITATRLGRRSIDVRIGNLISRGMIKRMGHRPERYELARSANITVALRFNPETKEIERRPA